MSPRHSTASSEPIGCEPAYCAPAAVCALFATTTRYGGFPPQGLPGAWGELRFASINIAAPRASAVAVHDTQRFFVVEDTGPGDQFARSRQCKRAVEIADLALILASIAQRRVDGSHLDECGDANKRRRVPVEGVSAGGAEWTEAWHGGIKTADSRKAGKTRVFGAEHGLAQIFVRLRMAGAVVGQIFFALASLRPGEGLLGSVINAGNAEAE